MVVRPGVCRGDRAVIADAELLLLATRASAVRRGVVGVERPDDVPRFGVASDRPPRRAGVDVVRVIRDDVVFDADDDVGAA